MDKQIKENRQQFPPPAANAAVIRTCHNYWCNFTTREPLKKCPKCARPLLTAQTFRILGFVQAFLGGILAVGAVGLTILVAPKLSTVKGGTGTIIFILGIFGLLLAVGLTFFSAGIWQAFFGRRNQSLITFVLALLIALALVATIGRALLS